MNAIFNISNDRKFLDRANELFNCQSNKNLVYKAYLENIQQKDKLINHYFDFPCLPISFFKTHKVETNMDALSDNESKIFLSSGTGNIDNRSRHIVRDISIYEKNIEDIFCQFYGEVKQYYFVGLLPSYMENPYSSLIYMVDFLMRKGKNIKPLFFKESRALLEKINRLNKNNQKIILFGVAYSLLDFADYVDTNHISLGNTDNLIVVETGGMKGRRSEITKEELYAILQTKLGIKHLHSEYGMTELLSQAYSKEINRYVCPPQMKVFLTEINDPFAVINKFDKRGVINIIDLANRDSCAFIKTEDIGQINNDGTFVIGGRIDHAEMRGCNLMMDI